MGASNVESSFPNHKNVTQLLVDHMVEKFHPEIRVNAMPAPASIKEYAKKDREDEGIFYVPQAGKI